MNHCKSAKLGLILSLVLFIGLSGTALAAAPSAYWYLDDVQDGPYVDTLTPGSVNNGVCVPGACPTRLDTGNVGAAQTFDGVDDGIIVAAAAGADTAFDLQDDGNFSVEVWFQNVNAAGLPANGNTEVIVGRADGTTGNNMQWWIGVRNVGGTVQAAARLIDQEGDGAGVLISSTGTPVDITTAGWHQAILVKNGNDVSLYVDNTLEDTQTINYSNDQTGNGLTSTVAPLSIGQLYRVTDTTPGQSSFFDGDVDQVAIYTEALTADDVNASFTAGTNGELLTFAPIFPTTDFGMTALGYEFSINVGAVANPAITAYAKGTAPTDLSLDETTGDVDWIPTVQDIGLGQIFNVSATNTIGTTAQDLTVDVVDVCASLDAYWDLDETAEPFDGEVFGEPTHPDVNDAACIGTGCPTVDADVNAVNGALAFNGTDQGLEVPASMDSDKVFDWAATESFTISMFMKPNVTDFADGSTEVMVGRWLTVNGDANDPQIWIGLRDDAGGGVTPRLFARLEAANFDGDATAITDTVSPTALVNGTWYHVALVYDHTTGNVSIYIDGVLEARENITYDVGTNFADDTNPLNIGYLFNGTTNTSFFGGSLDEIAFFGSALNAAVLVQHATQNVGRGFCNDAPTIAASPAPAATAQAGVEYTFEPVATQDDEGDTLTWDLPTKPAAMTIDDATGAISWIPNNDDAAASPISVVVRVSDGFGGTDVLSYAITVSASDNVPPQITGQTAVSIATDASYTIEVGNLTIVDPDSTTFTLTVGSGTNFTVAGATVTPDSGFTGTLTVPVTVNDGVTESASFDFVITVGGSTGGGGGGGGGGCFIDSTMF